MSLLFKSEISGLLVNISTAGEKYSPLYSKNFTQPFRTQSLKNQLFSLNLFILFLKSISKSDHFKKTMSPTGYVSVTFLTPKVAVTCLKIKCLKGPVEYTLRQS